MYDLTLDIYSIRLVLQSLEHELKNWPGGDPFEQEMLRFLVDFFNRLVLEHSLELELDEDIID